MIMVHEVPHDIIGLHCHSAICLPPDDLIDGRKVCHLDVPAVKIGDAGLVEFDQGLLCLE